MKEINAVGCQHFMPSSYFSAENAAYIDEMRVRYQSDPAFVGESWRRFFFLGNRFCSFPSGPEGEDCRAYAEWGGACH